MGAYYGKGKRQGLFGSYLLGAYDPQTKQIEAITKIGTGFTDSLLMKNT